MSTHHAEAGYHRKTALIIVAAAILYVAGSWGVSLWDRDEAWYCQTSKQMVQSGDWVVPHFLDQPRYAKPIFIYWCQAASMTIFGANEFAARLVSGVAMTATLTMLGVVLSRAIGGRRAMLTVLIFSSSALVITAAKMCLTDSVLLLFITGMQLCLFRLYRAAGSRRPVGWRMDHPVPRSQGSRSTLATAMAMWVCTAMAVLTKGPVVFALMLGTMIALALLDIGRQCRSLQAWRAAIAWWKHIRFLRGLLIVLVVGLPWLLAAYLRHPDFIWKMLREPGQHFGSNQDGHWQAPGYFLVTIWLTYFPWSLLLPTALTLGWKHRGLPHVRFALAIILGNWVFAEMMVTKLPHYILPAFTSLAFLTATAVIRCVRRQHDDLDRKVFYGALGVWACGAMMLAALPYVGAWRLDDPARGGGLLFAAVGVAYVAAVVVLFARRRLVGAAAVAGGGMMLLITILYMCYLPSAAFLRLPQRVAIELERLRKLDGPGDGRVIMVDYDEPSLAFYQGGTIGKAEKPYLRQTPPEQWPRWIVISSKFFDSLPPGRQRCLQRMATLSGVNYNTGGKVVDLFIMRKSDTVAPQTDPAAAPEQ